MFNLPDLSGLIYFAFFGMACAAVVAIGGGWLLYHLTRAVLLYVGAV